MSQNHQTPPPAPGPLCAVYQPQLALLALGRLDEEQASDVRAHLADCEFCQRRLHEYEIVRGAFARHFGAEASVGREGALPSVPSLVAAPASPPPLSLEDIMRAAEKPPAPSTERPSPMRQWSPRQRRLNALGAIAAVLLLSLLAALLFTHLSRGTPAHRVTPTPTVNFAGAAVLGAPESNWLRAFAASSECPGFNSAGVASRCFCQSLGQTRCDYTVAIASTANTVEANGSVYQVVLNSTGTINTAMDFSTTLRVCIKYLPPGATIKGTQSSITQPGTYQYTSDIGQVSIQIGPGTCTLVSEVLIVAAG